MKKTLTLLFGIFGISVVSIAGLVSLGYYYRWEWVGVSNYTTPTISEGEEYQRAKTLWDWLELLIVPVALSGGAWILSENQKVIEENQVNERRRQLEYESYLSRMSQVLNKYSYPKEIENSTFDKATMRAWTLNTLRSLEPGKKGNIIQYLYDTNLISTDYQIIDLRSADLSNVDLERRFLPGINLSRSILTGANLKGVVLGGEFSIEVDDPSDPLNKIRLNGSDLSSADLTGADFTGAKLGGVNLKNAMIDDLEELKKNVEFDARTVFP